VGRPRAIDTVLRAYTSFANNPPQDVTGIAARARPRREGEVRPQPSRYQSRETPRAGIGWQPPAVLCRAGEYRRLQPCSASAA
jgi:hypothetical protein